jgi:uncharacterized protein with NRDE domain
MCLILFAYKMDCEHPLILGANRDEFYERPTAPLDWWTDHPYVLAGKDLRGGGTWMGITKTGRWAGITNFRDPPGLKPHAPSRGALVTDFLFGRESPKSYLEQIHQNAEAYNGFNLIVGDGSGLFYYSNYQHEIQHLSPGIYGLSNRFIDSPWPKVETGKAQLKKLTQKRSVDDEAIFTLLQDRQHPPPHLLPDTGVGMEWERILSPLFIHSDIYGTRSSSVIRMEKKGRIHFAERTFEKSGNGYQAGETRVFEF